MNAGVYYILYYTGTGAGVETCPSFQAEGNSHKAPLIILSGGHVHPMQTPYCEAIEMKKYVMEKFKIPESSILIDPYARHTTTNFRSAARLVFRYGIPTDLKALVTSSADHIAITTKDGFRIRCSTELGYFPMESISRISPVAADMGDFCLRR